MSTTSRARAIMRSRPTLSASIAVLAGLMATSLAIVDVLGSYGVPASTSNPTSIRPAARSSMHGRIAYTSKGGDIWVMRADGTHRRRVTRARGKVDFDPDFSPDGKRIVFRSERGRQPPDPYGIGYDAIFIVRLDGKRLRQINPPSGGLFPAWSPRGNEIAFSGAATGNPMVDDIEVMTSTGANVRDLGVPGEEASWSPDGSRIAYASHRGDGNWAVWIIGADGSSPRQLTFPVLTPPAGMNGDSTGAWSPDGSRIVYSSVIAGDRELYVMNADGSDKRRITHWRGGDSPNAWLPDGRIVFAHSARSAPLPRWYLIRADGSGLRSLPWLYGASDPLDWWAAHPLKSAPARIEPAHAAPSPVSTARGWAISSATWPPIISTTLPTRR
jgi:Tol biopolymer transport system component